MLKASERVLIVEDEVFVALDLVDIVEAAGYVVDGPYGTLDQTLKALERNLPKCAILDVKLIDGEIYPAADVLADHQVPVIFHSGHADSADLSARYPRAQTCAKPSTQQEINEALGRAAPL